MTLKKLFNISAAMLACVLALTVTSCNDDNDPEVPRLICDPAEVVIAPDNSATVTVSGGSAPYTVTSGDEAVATAVVDENTVTITGIAEGTTAIAITDKNKKAGTISVIVE